MKKTISLFLALVLLMSVFSLVFADEIGEQYYTVKVEYSDNVGKKEQLNLMVQGYNVYVDAKMLAERFGYTFGENGNCAVIFNKDKKTEAESVAKRLLASGMSADEILEKLK